MPGYLLKVLTELSHLRLTAMLLEEVLFSPNLQV